jgi:CMP-N-acetylneuraminic acid synthetase
MLIVGTMWARGEGSTLKRKNVRKICGKQIVYWSLKNAVDAGFIDEIFVITEDEEIADTAKSLSCRVIERPREMLFYNAGFSKPSDWGAYIKKKRTEIIKGDPDISVGLNCNICLLQGETLRKMYIRLMENDVAGSIFPVVEVEPHLYMENPNTGYLFPVWDDPGIDRQQFPKLYRRIGIPIDHNQRIVNSVYWRQLYHTIPFEESIDIHGEQDLKIAELFLSERLMAHPHQASATERKKASS